MKQEEKLTFLNKTKYLYISLIKRVFPGYWESKEYFKENNIFDDFSNELKKINQRRTKYAVFFILLLISYYIINDFIPSKIWTKEQKHIYLTIDCIFFFILVILLFAVSLKIKILKSLEVQHIVTHTLIVSIILWSTAISSIETNQLNYFATYIITLIALSFFFHLKSIVHAIYLAIGFYLLMFHYSWNNNFFSSEAGAYYEIVIIISIMTFIIARILIVARMNAFMAHHKLIILNDTLDKKVHTKTRELTEANKELEYEIDIRKRYQESLTKAKRKAEESDRLKSTFLANMSHEIRTPMNGILGFSELLSKREVSPEKTKKYLTLIYSNSKQLLVLLDDILDISKIEANQLKVYPEETEITPILENVQEFFVEVKSRMEKEAIEIKLEIPEEDKKTSVYADPIRLGQILNNLTKNAIKFTEKGTVTIGYKKNLNETKFYVKDSGIGIHESKLEFIFNRFNQVDTNNENNQGGTGLGLTISKGLVELMGGEIWCESEINKGSTFYFTLPNTRTYLNKRFNIDLITYQGKKLLANATVLFVDDNEASFQTIKEYLEPYDVKIYHARNSKQAVAKCASSSNISVVIMDLLLNKKESNQAIELIRKCREDLPIIAQTSNTKYLEDTDIWDDIILKPIKEKDLITTLIRNIPTI